MDEELLNRQPPHSLEAEQSVLGSILIDSHCLTDVIGLVKPEDFYLPQNREIYETIYTMFNFSQTIDPVTVLDKMRELGVYQDQSRDYIMQLMEITPTAANVVRYAKIVRERSMLRGLAQAGLDIAQIVHEQVGTPSEMLEAAEKKIYQKIIFDSMAMPNHESLDCLYVINKDLDVQGKFIEQSWHLEMKVGGRMQHICQKAVSI